jgi:phenylpropionate dioxygenase-like ring-hydroxylating dioxygenase large terminal subunit
MPHLKNHWFIACASSQLGAEPKAVELMNHLLVVYRDHEGRAHALEDRCCHRGVQLSLGCVKQGHIACRYHGWEYDGTGRCVHVPSLPAGTPVPQGFRVRAFPCVEQDHYVWVWTGEDEPGSVRPLPIEGAAERSWRQGVVEADCCAEFLLENILDSSHVPFVHKGTHPAYFLNRMKGFQEYDYEVRVEPRGLLLFFPPTASADIAFDGESAASYIRFTLPDRVQVYQRGAANTFHLTIHLVRRTDRSARMEWLMQMRHQEGAAPSVEWLGADNLTLQQDIALLESAQGNYDLRGADFERSVPADFALLLSRKVLALVRAGEWEARRSELTQRKLVRVRQ